MKFMRVLLILSVFLPVFASGSFAQMNRGKVYIGVSSTFSLADLGPDIMGIGFTSIKYKSDQDGYEEPDPDRQTRFNLTPEVGFFVIDGLLIGIDISLAYSVAKDGEWDSKATQLLFGAGPFVRYYLPTEKVIPFVDLGSSFGVFNSKYEDDSFDSEDKQSLMSFNGGVGMAVPVGDRVAFELMGGYNWFRVKDKEDNADNERMVFGTVGMKIGVVVLLGR
jgi:hypothetical protein